MKTSECDIVMIPGLGGSGPDHWQSRWASKLASARRVEQADWDMPNRALWEAALIQEVARSERPTVLVGHSLGSVLCVLSAPALAAERIAGAFLVTPPDTEEPGPDLLPLPGFAPLPRDPLPFPATVIASRTDPYCRYERAEDFSFAWGAHLVDAGESGHLNIESGHGPWPEGLMSFAAFLRKL